MTRRVQKYEKKVDVDEKKVSVLFFFVFLQVDMFLSNQFCVCCL